MGTRDMKGRVAIELITLNTRTHISLATNIAHELPASPVDVLDADNGFEEHRVSKVDLRYPNGAKDVCPQARVGLLEGSVPIGAQDALDLG